MNLFARIKLGLFGENNPSNFQQIFKKHILDTSIFSDAKDTEDLCQKYGLNYKKFANWAKYESERSEDSFEKRVLRHVFTLYCIQLSEEKIKSNISKLAEANAKVQKELDEKHFKM